MEKISLLLSNPEKMNQEDHSMFSKYDKLKKDLESEMHNWEKLTEQLEELKQQRI